MGDPKNWTEPPDEPDTHTVYRKFYEWEPDAGRILDLVQGNQCAFQNCSPGGNKFRIAAEKLEQVIADTELQQLQDEFFQNLEYPEAIPTPNGCLYRLHLSPETVQLLRKIKQSYPEPKSIEERALAVLQEIKANNGLSKAIEAEIASILEQYQQEAKHSE